MPEHTPKVFISATSADLRSVRGLVRDALLNMGCLPVVQEHFPPDYRDVSGMLRDKIAGCDALIHIAGDYKEAESLYREALKGFEAKLGMDHPHTEIIRENLESFLAEMAKASED